MWSEIRLAHVCSKSLHKAQELKTEYEAKLPDVPWHFIVNKSDLPSDPELQGAIRAIEFSNAELTSAKTGNTVAEVFEAIASEMNRAGK